MNSEILQSKMAMKSLFSIMGKRLTCIGAVLGLLMWGMVAGIAQPVPNNHFTEPGGIGFDIEALAE